MKRLSFYFFLFFIFYFLLVPISKLLIVIGHDRLRIKDYKKKGGSYWIARKETRIEGGFFNKLY